jgi:hypothetical protein
LTSLFPCRLPLVRSNFKLPANPSSLLVMYFLYGDRKIVNPFLQCTWFYCILTWERPSSCLPPLSCTQTPQSCRYTLRWFQAFSLTWSLVRTTPGPVPQSNLKQSKVYSRAGTRSSGSLCLGIDLALTCTIRGSSTAIRPKTEYIVTVHH